MSARSLMSASRSLSMNSNTCEARGAASCHAWQLAGCESSPADCLPGPVLTPVSCEDPAGGWVLQAPGTLSLLVKPIACDPVRLVIMPAAQVALHTGSLHGQGRHVPAKRCTLLCRVGWKHCQLEQLWCQTSWLRAATRAASAAIACHWTQVTPLRSFPQVALYHKARVCCAEVLGAQLRTKLKLRLCGKTSSRRTMYGLCSSLSSLISRSAVMFTP